MIDVNGTGGFVKQYQVLVDPAKLRKFDLTLHDIYDAVAKNNAMPAAMCWSAIRSVRLSAAWA